MALQFKALWRDYSRSPSSGSTGLYPKVAVGNTRYRDTLETQGKYSLSPGEGTCGSGGSVGSYSLLSREKKGVRILPRGNSPRGPGPRDYSPCNKPPPSHARISSRQEARGIGKLCAKDSSKGLCETLGEAAESYVVSVPRPFRLSASGRNKIHPSIHARISLWRRYSNSS
jgi:hypothetical protein